MATIDEEKKNVVRKLEAEKRELKIENESLKKKIYEFEESVGKRLSPRHHVSIIKSTNFINELLKAYQK